MATAHDIAKYFISLSNDDNGDLISNLKLQKLLYYAQGLSLAANNTPLFEEDIEAWMHGPVVPSVYQTYRVCGADAIPPPEDYDVSRIENDTRDILDEIWIVFGQFSAWKLRNMTHDEPPWKNAYDETCSKVITKESMRDYFLTQLVIQ